MSLESSVASSLDSLPIDLGDLPQMIQFECYETCAWFEVFAGMSGHGDRKLSQLVERIFTVSLFDVLSNSVMTLSWFVGSSPFASDCRRGR